MRRCLGLPYWLRRALLGRTFARALRAALVPLLLFGQAVTPPPAAAPPAATAKVDEPTLPPIELSPFEVRATDDVGYQAGNTVSGSRLNSRLKDPPASISPFTAEFLSERNRGRADC